MITNKKIQRFYNLERTGNGSVIVGNDLFILFVAAFLDTSCKTQRCTRSLLLLTKIPHAIKLQSGAKKIAAAAAENLPAGIL